MEQLRDNFDEEASDALKHPSQYARNFLEYCSFRTLVLSTQASGYLEDKKFRRLTFDMMVAWEFPAASSQPFLSVSNINNLYYAYYISRSAYDRWGRGG